MQPQRDFDQPSETHQPTPPPVMTPTVHLYSAAPLPAEKKPPVRSSLLLVIIGIIAVPMALDKIAGALASSRKTGVVYQNREISQGEAKATINDFANISKSAKASFDADSKPVGAKSSRESGPSAKATAKDLSNITKDANVSDPSSLTRTPAQTEIGRRFQAIMQKGQEETLQYRQAIAEARSPDYLSPAQLGTENGRADARRIFEEYRAATTLYRSQSAELEDEITNFSKELVGQAPRDLAQHDAEQAEMYRLDDDQMATIDQVLNFVDQEKPRYDSSSNKLIFANDGDVDQYRQMASDLERKQELLEQRRAEILQGRQRGIAAANQRLQQDAAQP